MSPPHRSSVDVTRQEADLVRDAQADVPGAMDALVDQWLPVVLGWCMRMSEPGVHPEDAAHDSLERMIMGLGGLRDPVAFPAWLYQLTRRVLRRHAQRAWLRRWLPGNVPEVADTADDPLRLVGQAEIVAYIREAIAELPMHQREVLVLHDLEERSDSEVAKLLGIPRNTVKSRLRRARIALRSQVTDLEAPEARYEGAL